MALFLLGSAAVLQAAKEEKKDYTRYVNPLVGTDFTGHTFPGAAYPFGMVQLSPDTGLRGWEVCSGYHYSHGSIYGFTHTHLSGTGCEDYCDILLMPVSSYCGPIDGACYRSEFRHDRETASPGYYRVFLDRWGIQAELTAGRRVGMHRYRFPRDEEHQVVIDLTHRDLLLDGELEIVNGHTVAGFRRSKQWAQDQQLYFYVEFSEPFCGTCLEKSATEAGDKNTKVLLTFDTGRRRTVLAKIGLSSVSVENARRNLRAEVEGWEFDKLRKRTREAWNDYLGKIAITAPSDEIRRVFYTALYHTALAPNLYSDVTGEYRGMDRQVHRTDGHEQYTVFSLWDTYRALHPLFTIIERERTVDFIRSFQTIYEQGGKLPVWELAGNETNCMIGYHSVSVIADAWNKGITGFDGNALLEAMVQTSMRDEFGLASFRTNGLVRGDKEHESVSKTLEYAYDDWCIAQMARSLGRQDLYDTYIRRAQYYKNVFDPQTGFMRAKHWGRWVVPFLPTDVSLHFTEANSWQYSFYVPQDINTHIELLGGDQAYGEKLDALFHSREQTTGRHQSDITGLIGQYAHGNEPSHHAAYLYAYNGQHWKGQEMIHKILTELYTAAPDGLCGNDDCGQMSAWYVLSALGFYPVAPGSDSYVIGVPLVDRAVIRLENGRKFEINAPRGKSPTAMKYIQSATANGEPLEKTWFTHALIKGGGELAFVLGDSPNYDYGTPRAVRPVSQITESLIVPNPSLEMENTVFSDTMPLAMRAPSAEYEVWYKIVPGTTREEEPIPSGEGYTRYTEPVAVQESCLVYAYCRDKNGNTGFNTIARFTRIETDMKITLSSRYSRQYTAGGDNGLVDGVRGEVNFRLGGWQGYQATDIEAVVDMGEIRQIHSLGAGFLQDAPSWIWMPRYVEFFVSEDGENFRPAGRVEHTVDERDERAQIHDLVLTGLDEKARYVRIFVKRFGEIPYWHPGAGSQGMVFIDEILINR